jgi:hypothetical protein
MTDLYIQDNRIILHTVGIKEHGEHEIVDVKLTMDAAVDLAYELLKLIHYMPRLKED